MSHAHDMALHFILCLALLNLENEILPVGFCGTIPPNGVYGKSDREHVSSATEYLKLSSSPKGATLRFDDAELAVTEIPKLTRRTATLFRQVQSPLRLMNGELFNKLD